MEKEVGFGGLSHTAKSEGIKGLVGVTTGLVLLTLADASGALSTAGAVFLHTVANLFEAHSCKKQSKFNTVVMLVNKLRK